LENIKGIRFGMFIIEKNLVLILFGDSLLSGGGGGGTFGDSLFSGFIRNQKISGDQNFWGLASLGFIRSQKLSGDHNFRGLATMGTLQ